MSEVAAKLGDRVVGFDIHFVLIPSPGGPIPTPIPMLFFGRLIDGLSASVSVDNGPAAVQGSAALNSPGHVPPGGTFQRPPTDRATICKGSSSVFIDNKCAARARDGAHTCNDPSDQPNGIVVARGTVFIGG
jgi:uncharacterized Zn-binding protein involved in type VI secretion